MTVEAIKSVSLALFARNGYEGTSLADIAEGVGIKKPSLYAHFKGKEDLFLSVFQDVLWEHVAHAEQLMITIEHSTLEEKLFTILRDTCQYYLNHEDKITFLKRVMLFPPDFLKNDLRAKFLESEQAFTKILHSIFTEGVEQKVIRNVPIEDLLASYYCLIDGLFIQMFYYGTEKYEARLQSVWNIFWAGVKTTTKIE